MRFNRGLLSVGLCCAAAATAQTTASISGIVLDKTGASLPNVRVTARHIDTGLIRLRETASDGRFLFPALPVGAYEVRGERQGFRPVLRRGLTLSVGETANLELQMEVGAVDQEITVLGEAPLVNTHSPQLSYLVGERTMRELPLNGRNYTDLALLQPGVAAYPHRDGGSVVAHGLAVSINGQDPRSNVYLLDGTPQNDFTNGPAGSAAATVLGVETIREFSVETNAYSAEFGRNSGGQINALTKSGTNNLHGSLYHFLRNDNLDARNFFDAGGKPEFQRNQFGGTVGGPVRTDRAFFFLGYEALRERLGRTISTLTPDLNARRGVLPSETVEVSPVVRPYLDAFPLPNGPSRGSGLASYFFGFNQQLRQDFFQGRFDQNFSSRHQFFIRYTFDDADQQLPTDFPQFPRTFLSRNQFVTAEYRTVVSAATLNTVRLSFSRTRIAQDVAANLASPLQPFVPGRDMIGDIDIGGIPRFGPQSSVDVRLTQNIYGFEQSLAHTRGRHDIKTGALIERYQDNMVNPTFSLGIFTFGDLRDFLLNRPARYLGLGPQGALDRYWRFTLFGFYVQDNVRLSSRFTLNLGLRYEFSTMPVDIYGRDSALINLSDASPTPGPLYQNPTKKNLSPRAGFAWDPFGGGRTSVRGGYGYYLNTNNQQNLIVTVTNPPATPRLVIANPTFPVPPFERGVGNTMRPVEWKIKNPKLHVWNLNVQRQIWGDVLVTIGYAGSRGLHLWRSTDVNLPVPQRLADGTVFFPANAPRMNQAFTTIELKKSDGNSWYNAGILEIRKRWNRGFQFQSSYTFSRNIDTTQASTFFSDATNGTTSAMPEFPGFSYNKGLADYHAKHNWVMNGTWEIPLARDGGGLARVLARGWQISGISHVRSGNPLTLFLARNRSRSQWSPSLGPGLGPDRPSMAPGFTHETAVLGSPDRYFNPAAFVLPPAGTLGNLGRGALIGPNLRSVDLALMKNTRWAKLGDQANVQFRFEVFNAFNRANFGPPQLAAFNGAADNELPLASLGLVRSTVTSARQLQFGIRLSF
jgi:hypothetical protein